LGSKVTVAKRASTPQKPEQLWQCGQIPGFATKSKRTRTGMSADRRLAAGMDDFLTKPVSTAALFAVIDRLVFADGASRPANVDKEERRSLLDPVAVLTACGDNADGLRMMCQDLETHAPAQLAEVGNALRERDAPRLRQAAHKFCPLLFAFSTAGGNVASDLEDLATEGRLEEAQPLVEQLETMTRELMQLADGLSLDTLRSQAGAAQ
jgi:CheY-like chemotaxis protein